MKINCSKAKNCLNAGIRCEDCGAMSDIYNHYPHYKTKSDIDRTTALMVLSDISRDSYLNYDLFGRKIFCIRTDDFEKIRKKYLDKEADTYEVV